MKQWTTPQLLGIASGSEEHDKIQAGFEFLIFSEHEEPEGES
jgi:hypothetical protein